MELSKRSQTSVLLLLHSQMPSPSSSRDGNAAAIASSSSAGNFFCDDDGSLAQRRLTRQRKLRHVTDHELGLCHGHNNLTDHSQSRSRSSPASPESSRKLRSSAAPARDHRSFSAVPQPLPLPSSRRDVDQTATTSRLCHVGANAGDVISCCHAAEDGGGGLKTRASFPSRSAPTSPAASPRRISPGGDRDAPKLAAKTAAATARTQKAVSFPVCYKNWLPAEAPGEASHAGAHPLPLPPGAVGLPAKGQWQKGKLIGRGTFGSVYRGTNRETGALCAMKEVDLFPDDPKSVECIRQLEQEIEMLRQLKHPNIVQYYGSEVVDDHFYIYLEYVYPGSINKYVREHVGAVTESVVRNFTRHILSGLAYLHSRKTVHRDIKGANLLVDASGAVKLADFGMAKLLTGQSYDLSLKGSPYWMAPEVIKAAMQRNASPYLALAVDIWSLGCTIIEMINGRPPWSEFTGPQAMFKVLNTTPPIPETLSSEGKDFLSCCFRRNPVERPSAAKLLEHPFVRNLHHQNTSPTTHISSATNVMEKLHIQRDRGKYKFDLAPVSPRARAGNSNECPPYGGNTSSPWTLSL